jgi:hypothetical protein
LTPLARDKGEVKRVEVGFAGGQAIVMRITDGAYDKLRKAIQGGDRWYEVDSADGVVALDLGQVVFIKREPEEHRVGFSGA